MTTIASQITSPTVVYSTVYSDADQSKHQSSASLAFVWGIHRDRWIPCTKGQLRGKCFHLMTSSWRSCILAHILKCIGPWRNYIISYAYEKRGNYSSSTCICYIKSMRTFCFSICKANHCFNIILHILSAIYRRALLLWRHNGRDGVSNHQPHDCLLNRSFRPRSKKTSKLRVTGLLCAGSSPVTGDFPAQMASSAENVSIWWRHHDIRVTV